MENAVSMTIDGRQTQVPSDYNIMQAARQVGVNIPSLCYHSELTPTGGCGICMVELPEQNNRMVRACTTPVHEGLKVRTHSRELTKTRQEVLKLLLSNHPADCLQCIRSGNCELQTLAKQLG
jgi:NADH-quinone oxidoreductase subunit G